MTKDANIGLLLIRGAIASMEPEEQEKIKACAEELRAAVAKYGDAGFIALTLVGSEEAAKVEAERGQKG